MKRRNFIRGILGTVAAAIIPWQIDLDAGLTSWGVTANGGRYLVVDDPPTRISIPYLKKQASFIHEATGIMPDMVIWGDEYHVYERAES